jgi:SHS2 domain-containing protein
MRQDEPRTGAVGTRWEHFSHQADIGVRGVGATKEEAFEQGALGLTAVVTDVNSLEPKSLVDVSCDAPDDELLFVDWLNAIVYEMATRKMLFCRFKVHIDDGRLEGHLWGQQVDVAKHEPATEVKGATYTELQVGRDRDGAWIAQCVVDV